MIKYRSNMDAVLSKIKTMLGQNKLDALYQECALGVFASNERRVHNEGKDVNGRSIGKYSQKPIYVNPNKSPRKFPIKFPIKGKTGKTVFASTGKPHKTKYFDAGYSGFKSEVGFGNKVNLQLTGRLRADWTILKSVRGYEIGWASSYGTNVAEGNEARFGKQIWGLSKQDKEAVHQIIKRYLKSNA